MPYVGGKTREKLDPKLILLIEKIKEEIPEGERDGVVNYVISRIVAATMKPEDGWRYKSLAHAAEVFAAAGSEFRRRLVDQYEDKAIEKNGDIPEYDHPFMEPRSENSYGVCRDCCPVHGCKYRYVDCPVDGNGGMCTCVAD